MSKDLKLAICVALGIGLAMAVTATTIQYLLSWLFDSMIPSGIYY